MNMNHFDDIGKLVLRVSIASVILVHGIQKITMPAQITFIEGLLTNIGLPAFLAYGVYIGEVIAPLLMIAGFRTKIAAGIVSATMLVVILLGHTSEIFSPSQFLWWGIELQTTFLLGAISVAFLGAGKFALSRTNKWD